MHSVIRSCFICLFMQSLACAFVCLFTQASIIKPCSDHVAWLRAKHVHPDLLAGPHKLISCILPFKLYISVTGHQCCRHVRQAALQSNMWICTALQSPSNSKPSNRYSSSVKSFVATKHHELVLPPLNPGNPLRIIHHWHLLWNIRVYYSVVRGV